MFVCLLYIYIYNKLNDIIKLNLFVKSPRFGNFSTALIYDSGDVRFELGRFSERVVWVHAWNVSVSLDSRTSSRIAGKYRYACPGNGGWRTAGKICHIFVACSMGNGKRRVVGWSSVPGIRYGSSIRADKTKGRFFFFFFRAIIKLYIYNEFIFVR